MTRADGQHAGRPPARWTLMVAELGFTVAAIVVYFLIRGAHPDDVPASMDRARAVIRLELRLGIFREAAIQEPFLDHRWSIDLANFVYVWGMYPVMAVVGVWLAIKDLSRFRYARNVLLVSACMGIVGYWLIPTAPPRLMDGYGFVDTLHQETANIRDLQPSFFVNEYAALPSFHFAWLALVVVAAWTTTRNLLARTLAVVVSLLMIWAIIVTANHFFIDLVLGLALVGIAWWLTELLYRLTGRRRGSANPPPQDVRWTSR